MSVVDAREVVGSRLFGDEVARAVVGQIVRGVAFLHGRGVVHGDLHEGNVLFRAPRGIHGLSQVELYEKYGQPLLEKITRLDGQSLDSWVPTHGVIPIWFGGESDTLSLADSQIFLNDFSESFRPAVDVPKPSHTPYILLAPELLLEPSSATTFASEIWSLACAMFAVMGQYHLFDTWFPSRDRILEEQVDALGYLPEDMWERWVNREKSFDGELRKVDGEPRRLLEDRFGNSIQNSRKECEMTAMDDEEQREFLLLLRGMLAFRPKDRLTAQEVLQSRWMQRWGEPAVKVMNDNVKTSRRWH
ncbi:kinase-like protein [Plenodomus tracheiphilus IPT5]|uniref:Kinase-like protein n=1 Tax=Plenodomus tracheiphilus IPT5 TaxID=1408161 RepID=A0A6A7B6M8_9PLEO|nr:kinase-like protein [Plenodomus tracheiphilus IPT5]